MKPRQQPSCQTLSVLSTSSPDQELFHHVVLEPPDWDWTPGQFVMLRPQTWTLDPFSSRPFSIADLNSEGLHIHYQVVGKATRQMTALKPKDPVTVWGPLGRGFAYDPKTPTLLLAGGMGVIPFLGLIRSHPKPGNLELLFGHRHDLKNYPYQEIADTILVWNLQDKIAKDLKKLHKALKVKIDGYSRDGTILACGPVPFLKEVQELVMENEASCQLSLETTMVCGVGACLGCVVHTRDGGQKQACVEGPVFNAAEIVLPSN
ncbi:dihydroorotate dehydrogenase [Desulfovermiculus halophilus]|uniref:iron-sulfur cluster-binding protein n=1 Tax=Desulfovermiculus halophilus TaxID=339722 RepID=UPI00055726E5|nr:dihydroorotate dehydrogenase [Desulfovermiculus halophilus]